MVNRKLPKKVIESVNEFREVLEASGTTVDSLIVFGSYAKGNEKPGSDIDLCVISKQFGKDDVVEMQELFKKASRVNTFIEPYPLNPKDLQDEYNPIVREILETGVIV